MFLIHPADLFQKARAASVLTRQEEISCARSMRSGDPAARERLLQSCLPAVAGHVSRAPEPFQTLGLVYCCLQAAGRAVDSFSFEQDSETFAHRLSWHLRQATARYIADSRAAGYQEAGE